MKAQKPIFIISVGRSGSTLLHHVLCEHPDAAWLSWLCRIFPARPAVNGVYMRTLDVPGLRAVLRRLIYPGEWYGFWESCWPGFAASCRDPNASDVTERVRAKALRAVAQTVTPRRRRFIAKITGWPRVGFLQAVFEDARFVHIVRDGRPVVSSLLQVDWWRGWQGPSNWRWGDLTPSQAAEWERHDRSFVALAAIQWKILMDATERARQLVEEDRFLEVRYEDLCANPPATLRTIADFCELRWTPRFARRVAGYQIENQNHKWRAALDDQQREVLERCLAEHLARYGYA
jgi:hypothetical protein